MRLPTAADAATLEDLIDAIGIYEVLSVIEGICAEKADFIRSAWQDPALSKAWDKAGAKLCALSTTQTIKVIS